MAGLNDIFTPGKDPKPAPQVTFGAKLPDEAPEGAFHVMEVEAPAPEIPVALPPQPPSNGGGLSLGSSLPPALPSFDYNSDQAYMMLGMEYAHRTWLSRIVLQRAEETNDLHDGLLAVIERASRLENELAEARQDKAKIMETGLEFQRMATEINDSLAKELDVVRDERDLLRDEVATLKLHKGDAA